MKIFKNSALFAVLAIQTLCACWVNSQAEGDILSQEIPTESLRPACPEIKKSMQDVLEKAGVPYELQVFESADPELKELYLGGFWPSYFVVVPSVSACVPNPDLTTFTLYKAAARFMRNHSLKEKLLFFTAGGIMSVSSLHTTFMALKKQKNLDWFSTIALVYLASYTVAAMGGGFYKKLNEAEAQEVACDSLVKQGNVEAVFQEILKNQDVPVTVPLKTLYAPDWALRENLKRDGLDFESDLYQYWKAQYVAHHHYAQEELVKSLVDTINTCLKVLNEDGGPRFDFKDRHEKKALYHYNLVRELLNLSSAESFDLIDQGWLATAT